MNSCIDFLRKGVPLALMLSMGSALMAQIHLPDSLATEVPDSINNKTVQIERIFLIGNKRTKEFIILRELDFKEGEFYNKLDLINNLKANRNKVYNTRLFNSVDIRIIDIAPDKVDILVSVSERWYLFPIPVLDFADRNLNDWIRNQDADLSRLIYGLRLYQYNVRGRNERLRLSFTAGFENSFGISYRFPYIDKNRKIGFNLDVGYRENKNLAVYTLDHVQQFVESEQVLRREISGAVSFSYRPSFYNFHGISLSYRDREVSDTIVVANENYFNDSSQIQRYLTLSYSFTRDKRDIAAYPLNGYFFNTAINKYGLGIVGDLNQFDLTATYARYMNLGKRFYLSTLLQGYTSAPKNQPYANFRGLGFGRWFVRGYEVYLIEGQHYALNKWTLKWQLLNTVFFAGKFIKMEQFNTIPFAIYLKTYVDGGYVSNTIPYPNSDRLSDKFLAGYGFGIDLVTYYDITVRFEYSFNNNGDSGIFFGIMNEF